VIKKIFAIAMLCLTCLGGGLLTAAPASTDLNITISPEHILIGAGYNGEHVAISGKVPSDATVFVRVTGKPEHSKLKQKGKAMGVLWMNLGSVEISKAPDVFLLYLPEGVSRDASQNGQPAWRSLGIGLEHLRTVVGIVAEDANKNDVFDEYIKLKEKSGLYGIVDNAVHYGQNNGIMKSFSAVLSLPAALPQGTYQIEVLTLTNGSISTSAEVSIDAKEVGMPLWISELAFDHSTLYGVLAVLVALIAGLVTGIIFKGEKGAH
jgi:uncharacterized protein (TIGR02186 family)